VIFHCLMLIADCFFMRKIGIKNETSLHRDLKYTYAGPGGQTEVDVDGFVADGITATGEYIEVQAKNFGSIKKKALTIASQGRLRIVYPVIITKYIEVYNKKNMLQYRRKSPKKGNPWDIFNALIHAPELPLIPGIAIELALVDVTERRVRDGKGTWRRKGVSIHNRQLMTIHESICLGKNADYLRFIPFKKKELFTSGELAEKAGIQTDLARKTLYVLTKIGMVERVGKQGNSIIYSRRKAIPRSKS